MTQSAIDLCGVVQNLSPSAVGQQIPIPPLQLMCSTHCIQYFLPRLQPKMICVIQTEHTPCFSQLIVGQAFKRCLCRDGHEDRQWNGAMREVEGACAGFGGLPGTKKKVDISNGLFEGLETSTDIPSILRGSQMSTRRAWAFGRARWWSTWLQ